MKKTVNVAIMGIGTVGGGTYEILTGNHDFLLRTQGIDFRVKKVLDKNLDRIRSFGIPESAAAASVDEIAADKDISVVVETMGGVEPAKTFIEKVLLSGPVAHPARPIAAQTRATTQNNLNFIISYPVDIENSHKLQLRNNYIFIPHECQFK